MPLKKTTDHVTPLRPPPKEFPPKAAGTGDTDKHQYFHSYTRPPAHPRQVELRRLGGDDITAACAFALPWSRVRRAFAAGFDPDKGLVDLLTGLVFEVTPAYEQAEREGRPPTAIFRFQIRPVTAGDTLERLARTAPASGPPTVGEFDRCRAWVNARRALEAERLSEWGMRHGLRVEVIGDTVYVVPAGPGGDPTDGAPPVGPEGSSLAAGIAGPSVSVPSEAR